MKKVLLAATLGIAASANVVADGYFKVQYSKLDVELSIFGMDADPNPSAVTFTGGQKITDYFALEGFISTGTSEDAVEVQSYSVGDFQQNLGYGVSAVGMIPIGNIMNIYGKVGYMEVSYKDSYSDEGKGNANGILYGAGVVVELTDTLGVNLEYLQYPDGDYDSNGVDALSLGLSVAF